MAVLLAIGTAVGAGDLAHPAPSTLQGPTVAAQIAVALQQQRQSQTPPVVTCPRTIPVRTGWQFVCRVGGRSGPAVDVREIDNRGGLRWQLPR